MKDTSHNHIQLLQSWRRVCGFLPPVSLGAIHIWLFQSRIDLYIFLHNEFFGFFISLNHTNSVKIWYIMHSSTLIYAIVFINLACLFYTIGVWAERIKRRLEWWHVIFFFAGLICDTIGTTAMSMLSGSLFKLNFHGITGNTAILLMLFHAIWATTVLIRKNEKMILKFHRFSIVVWIIWLIPMISGMIYGGTR